MAHARLTRGALGLFLWSVVHTVDAPGLFSRVAANNVCLVLPHGLAFSSMSVQTTHMSGSL